MAEHDQFNPDNANFSKPPEMLCDAIDSIGVHNGVARIMFARLTASGAAAPSLELLIPHENLQSIVTVLQSIEV